VSTDNPDARPTPAAPAPSDRMKLRLFVFMAVPLFYYFHGLRPA